MSDNKNDLLVNLLQRYIDEALGIATLAKNHDTIDKALSQGTGKIRIVLVKKKDQ
jgi:hypothetical protein